MWWSSTIYVKDPTWWRPGKSVQIENTWVWAAQNGIGIVRHGHSSKDIDAQLSKFEHDGEKKYRSGTPIAKLWRQTRENRNRAVAKSRKRDSVALKEEEVFVTGGKKKPVFEGRPMQFPAWENWSCTKTDTESRSEPSMPRGLSESRNRSVRGRS